MGKLIIQPFLGYAAENAGADAGLEFTYEPSANQWHVKGYWWKMTGADVQKVYEKAKDIEAEQGHLTEEDVKKLVKNIVEIPDEILDDIVDRITENPALVIIYQEPEAHWEEALDKEIEKAIIRKHNKTQLSKKEITIETLKTFFKNIVDNKFYERIKDSFSFKVDLGKNLAEIVLGNWAWINAPDMIVDTFYTPEEVKAMQELLLNNELTEEKIEQFIKNNIQDKPLDVEWFRKEWEEAYDLDYIFAGRYVYYEPEDLWIFNIQEELEDENDYETEISHLTLTPNRENTTSPPQSKKSRGLK